ncbi:GntR family transcriptional regulator [Leucobacter sp. CSA1]|uniref:GntR family transcriptional regulator n=1 Tax=Leucobacter chromiisoli TaxID=2796471 RepID=A0A934QBG8_9MICO|nr:GntR family transcriptional regulator [Leucobacter chromiisoli]MBK0420114.1 GntR family transcriptional regulator [Leucobacter chromiisoli]
MPSPTAAPEPGSAGSRAQRSADALRELIADGALAPGDRLREAELAARLDVSRNTLREAFRMLSQEGLISQIPHRGALVAIPTAASIVDLFRVRRLVECQAVREASPSHPAVALMRDAVESATGARERGDWRGVGSSNLAFHAAVVSLTDSPRLAHLYRQLAAELRLSFGLVDDPARLYAPFLDRNAEILHRLEAGEPDAAASALEDYLVASERILLAAHERPA